MEQAVKVPLRERINLRIVVFALVILVPVGLMAYIYVRELVTGGIVDRGEFVEVDIKAMSSFEMDQSNATLQDIPEKWRQLDGKKVLLEGEVVPSNYAGNSMGDFQICYSVAKCCVSTAPKVQHFIDVRIAPGRRVEINGNLVRVMGTLRVNLVKENGRILSVWQLDAEKLETVG
jgi:hypothetical protein